MQSDKIVWTMNKEEYIQRVVPLRGWIYGIAYRFLRNREDCRDISQEVYIQLWIRRADLDECRCIESYAGRTAQFLCIDHLRRIRQHRRAMEYFSTHPPDTGELTCKHDQLLIFLRVREIAETLPPDIRDTFLLHEIDGLQYHEIAARYGMSLNWVYQNISRARKRLIEQIIKEKLHETR